MWKKTDDYLQKIFEFDSFVAAIDFINQVAKIAEELDHHPKIINNYNKVEIQTTTHSEGGKITDKDRLLVDRIDDLGSQKSSSKPVKLEEAKLYTDGGSRGNPGPSAAGCVVLDMDDNVVKNESQYLGLTTNNQAEYQALKIGLEICQALNIPKVHVFMDSLLIINQMNGTYKIKNQDLRTIYQSVNSILKNFSEVTFTHIPRELNKLADGMVNDCLDAEA